MGADLEASTNDNAGWADVVKSAAPPIKASLVKVPHHASPGAHDDQMWDDLLEDGVIAVITPWARGGLFLPTEADLSRLRALTSQVYVTALPRLVKARKDAELQKLLRKLGADDLKQLRGWGQVRARRRLNAAEWTVEVFGDARAVE